ncbi:MAG TPA: YtxH domain-containing protein [Actinomycetota bacterium]
MGFKTGMIIGFGVGYVLGTKAGRERYEELRQSWQDLMGNPRVQEAVERGKGLVGTATREGLTAVQGGVEKAAGAVKDRLDKDEDLGTG